MQVRCRVQLRARSLGLDIALLRRNLGEVAQQLRVVHGRHSLCPVPRPSGAGLSDTGNRA
jgi:hypothetical protein